MKKLKEKNTKIGFSFYYKGKEYVVEADNQNEARELFYKLIKKK